MSKNGEREIELLPKVFIYFSKKATHRFLFKPAQEQWNSLINKRKWAKYMALIMCLSDFRVSKMVFKTFKVNLRHSIIKRILYFTLNQSF